MSKQNGVKLSCGKAGCCIIVFPDNGLYDSTIYNVLAPLLRGQRHDSQFVLFTLSTLVGMLQRYAPDTNKPA